MRIIWKNWYFPIFRIKFYASDLEYYAVLLIFQFLFFLPHILASAQFSISIFLYIQHNPSGTDSRNQTVTSSSCMYMRYMNIYRYIFMINISPSQSEFGIIFLHSFIQSSSRSLEQQRRLIASSKLIWNVPFWLWHIADDAGGWQPIFFNRSICYVATQSTVFHFYLRCWLKISHLDGEGNRLKVEQSPSPC